MTSLPGLDQLPPELRNQLYMVYMSQQTISISNCRPGRDDHTSIPLLEVSPSLGSEATWAALNYARLVLHLANYDVGWDAHKLIYTWCANTKESYGLAIWSDIWARQTIEVWIEGPSRRGQAYSIINDIGPYIVMLCDKKALPLHFSGQLLPRHPQLQMLNRVFAVTKAVPQVNERHQEAVQQLCKRYQDASENYDAQSFIPDGVSRLQKEREASFRTVHQRAFGTSNKCRPLHVQAMMQLAAWALYRTRHLRRDLMPEECKDDWTTACGKPFWDLVNGIEELAYQPRFGAYYDRDEMDLVVDFSPEDDPKAVCPAPKIELGSLDLGCTWARLSTRKPPKEPLVEPEDRQFGRYDMRGVELAHTWTQHALDLAELKVICRTH